MQVLVVGGTGPTGPHVVDGLLARGHDVAIFHRGVHELSELPDVEHLHGDPHFRASIDDTIKDRSFDLVVAMYGRAKHLAPALKGRCGQFVSISGVAEVAKTKRAAMKPSGLPASRDLPRPPGAAVGALIVAQLLVSLEFSRERTHRDGGQSHDVDGAARTEIDGQVGHRLNVGSVDDRNEVIESQNRILVDHVAPERVDFVIDGGHTFGMLVNGLATLRSQGAQKNVSRHSHTSLFCLQTAARILGPNGGHVNARVILRHSRYRRVAFMAPTRTANRSASSGRMAPSDTQAASRFARLRRNWAAPTRYSSGRA